MADRDSLSLKERGPFPEETLRADSNFDYTTSSSNGSLARTEDTRSVFMILIGKSI